MENIDQLLDDYYKREDEFIRRQIELKKEGEKSGKSKTG